MHGKAVFKPVERRFYPRRDYYTNHALKRLLGALKRVLEASPLFIAHTFSPRNIEKGSKPPSDGRMTPCYIYYYYVIYCPHVNYTTTTQTTAQLSISCSGTGSLENIPDPGGLHLVLDEIGFTFFTTTAVYLEF